MRSAFIKIGEQRLGFERSQIFIGGQLYMDRWVLHLGGPTIRLHKFWRGDDDRASHDHPWPWFVTLPLSSYQEDVYRSGRFAYTRKVPALRLSLRTNDFEHIVVALSKTPLWTLVITGSYRRKWGFWPEPGKFVPYKKWPGAVH